jgi:hypothetical protein
MKIMKRNKSVFLGALLVLGLSLAQPSNVLAQYEQEGEQGKGEKPSAEVEAKMTEALKTDYPDAALGEFRKVKDAGTNKIFAVEFTARGDKMRAQVASDGTIVETEEPGDIKTFPAAASDALRKAITAMGTKDNGIRFGRTYFEVQEGGTNGVALVKLSEPMLTYRADVANNKGKPGKYSFKADGTQVEQPTWGK